MIFNLYMVTVFMKCRYVCVPQTAYKHIISNITCSPFEQKELFKQYINNNITSVLERSAA